MRQDPRLQRTDRDYEAAKGVTVHDESLRGDNTDAWEERCRPLYVFLDSGGKSLGEIKAWARRERLPVTVIEECLYWLLAQNRVVRELGVWRLVRR
jgi:hypothetical protein